MIRAVSFDFGQTLASIDPSMLVRKARMREVVVDVAAIETALPSAWTAYDRAVRAGVSGHPWKLFMHTLLTNAGGSPRSAIDGCVDFLWDEQPKDNLWRCPVPGMIELCKDLRARGIRIGILTNSEGRAAELVEEIGWSGIFDAVVDSGRVGIEKPDPKIFELMAEALGTPMKEIVHIGDSLGADVLGAVRAGMRAVWFRALFPGSVSDAEAAAPEGVAVCHDAPEVAAALEGMFRGA